MLSDVPVSVWEDFHAGRAAPQAELEACWARSRELGAPPAGVIPDDGLVRGDALRMHVERLDVLRASGAAVLDRATAQLARRDFLMLLADADGVVVRTSGGGGFAEIAQDVRLIEGACWSEASRGTNAIGTAAAANIPTEVHGHAHFGRRYHELVCYAAPVRGLDGRTLAVVDATSRIELADPAVAAMVLEAARSLEDLVRLEGYARAGTSVARALARTLDRMRDPALLVEAPGRVARANAAARELLAGASFEWAAIVREGIAPTDGGLPVILGQARRAWRLRAEPIATPAGEVVAALVVLEPGRTVAVRRAGSMLAAADPFAAIVAEDAAVTAAITWSRKLAASDVPVMLLAETGAGKELFARAIHDASPRARGPWHAINCGAVAPALLEAELFGYAPGAFTGADPAGRAGLFAAASGGTLFLDEVAEMPAAMQAALLRVVETGTYRRVGDVRLERTDVRIVCATCRDVSALRPDLYYRLVGATVRIPPLRERTDIVALATALAAPAELAPCAQERIARYAWPGNVRELKSSLAVAKVAADGSGWIEAHHLPIAAAPAVDAVAGLDGAERDAVVRALAQAGGNVSEAARILGVARSTVHRMKRRYGLE